MPDVVRRVCKRLNEAGFEAFTVGGAVRDAVLGRAPGDWDVASSAHPDEVMKLFSHTIPTGLQHGTVTVVIGKGSEREAIEVTTFRGDGDYSDSRRPDSVVFGVPLEEDLARRDFVVNAMAYDPVSKQVADPFGGLADIQARRLRAVGDARERFGEDGLRVMRAIRFAATLEFDLDPETEAAIPGALPSLAKVSRERVRVEMLKLLASPVPSRGLEIGQRTDVFSVAVDPHLDFKVPGSAAVAARWRHTMQVVDGARGPLVRFAALLAFAENEDEDEVDRRMRELTLSNSDRDVVVRMYRAAAIWQQLPLPDPGVRRYLGRLGRSHVARLVELLNAQLAAFDDGADRSELSAFIQQVERIVDSGDALVAKELCLSGGQLIKALDLEPGKVVGQLMAALLEKVLDDPSRNTSARLEALARELLADLQG